MREIMREAARRGGEVLKSYFQKRKDFMLKGEKDYVTVADRESEEKILEFLKKEAPEVSILSEETGGKRDKENFIIDPLDGTKNFVMGIPFFCISIGYEKDGKIISGVVYDPVREEMFEAERGKGAYLNGERIRVRENRFFHYAVISTAFPPTATGLISKYLLAMEEIILKTSALRRFGAAALEIAWSAAGRFDGFFHFRLNPWDVAAGSVLLEEAGGVITDPYGGKEILKGDIVGGSPEIHRELLEIIKRRMGYT